MYRQTQGEWMLIFSVFGVKPLAKKIAAALGPVLQNG